MTTTCLFFKSLCRLSIVFILVGLTFISCRNTVKSETKSVPKTENVNFKYHYEIKEPSKTNNKAPLLVLLHGRGSNEKDLFSFADYLDSSLILVAPRAPISLGKDRYQWYNMDSQRNYNSEEVIKTVDDLMEFIGQIKQAYAVDDQKIFVGGFSQGGIMSLGLGLLKAEEITGGVICLSGLLLPDFKTHLSPDSDLDELEMFLSHGKKDLVLPFENVEKDVKYIKDLDINIQEYYYDSAHTISRENFNDMFDWLNYQLKK